MEKKEQNKTEQRKKQLITVSMLHKAIIDGLNPDNFDESTNARYVNEKTGILDLLFHYAGRKEEATNEKANSRLPLLAFSFFLSSNSDFPYNWSYLINKNKQFYDFLDKFKDYINFVAADLSEIMEGLDAGFDITFRIDGMFTVNVQKQNNRAELRCTTETESIHKIFGISRDSYDLAVFVENTFIGEYRRKMGTSEKDIIIDGVRRNVNGNNTNDNEKQ